MKKYFITFYLIIISTFFSCCDRFETRFFYVKNDSKSAIVCFMTKKELSLTKTWEPLLAVDVEPNKEGYLNPGKPSWERLIKKCDGQKLHFYIIYQDSINKYGSDTVFKKNMYAKKYYFTIEDLEKINFHMTYRGDKPN